MFNSKLINRKGDIHCAVVFVLLCPSHSLKKSLPFLENLYMSAITERIRFCPLVFGVSYIGTDADRCVKVIIY